MKKNKKSVKSVTLIELIAVIMILGLAISALMGILSQVTNKAWFEEDIAKASFCAQTGMERVKSIKDFINITNSPYIANATLRACSSSSNYTVNITASTFNNTSNVYKLITVTGTQRSPYNNTVVKLYTLIGNCSGQVCF